VAVKIWRRDATKSWREPDLDTILAEAVTYGIGINYINRALVTVTLDCPNGDKVNISLSYDELDNIITTADILINSQGPEDKVHKFKELRKLQSRLRELQVENAKLKAELSVGGEEPASE
jgi:hypothetical protein